MAETPEFQIINGVSFSVQELTGALGDSITVLPLIVALAIATPISLPHVLIAFGIFQVVWGIRYGLPLSVEPMKAFVALVIVGTLTHADLIAAGVLIGVMLLVLGTVGALSWVAIHLGEPVIRGVQLAVALLLGLTGIELAMGDPVLAGVGVAIAVLFVLIGMTTFSAMAILGAGCIIAIFAVGLPAPAMPGLPTIPDFGDLSMTATLEGTAAQLAMTIGNAAIATSLLLSDYFERDISPDELGRTMGTMTLAALPIGGIPMCHGSGGLAGKYAFGARTGGANVILGVIYLLLAFVATAALIAAFPIAMLGVLLVVIAYELGRTAIETETLWLVVGMGVVAVLTNIGAAFLAGVGVWTMLRWFEKR